MNSNDSYFDATTGLPKWVSNHVPYWYTLPNGYRCTNCGLKVTEDEYYGEEKLKFYSKCEAPGV
jgi:hypothetical protein